MTPRGGRGAPELGALLSAETVASIRLDDILPVDRHIDLVKIDVEGAEYTALLGCQSLLTRDRPIIISEFSPNQMPGISGNLRPGLSALVSGTGIPIWCYRA